jgi:hypothetical protein
VKVFDVMAINEQRDYVAWVRLAKCCNWACPVLSTAALVGMFAKLQWLASFPWSAIIACQIVNWYAMRQMQRHTADMKRVTVAMIEETKEMLDG